MKPERCSSARLCGRFLLTLSTLCLFLPPGVLQKFGNVLWVCLFGWWIALLHLILGVIMFCTIIGIPYGKLAFRLAGYWLWPFARFVLGVVRTTPPSSRSQHFHIHPSSSNDARRLTNFFLVSLSSPCMCPFSSSFFRGSICLYRMALNTKMWVSKYGNSMILFLQTF